MATISSPGVGSGLDVNSIISQLIAIERQPIRALEAAATKIETRISAFGKIQSAFSSLRDAAAKLSQPATFRVTTAVTADASVVGVKNIGNALPGNYSIRPIVLAAAQATASKTYAAANAVVGEGTLTIDLGSWDAGNTVFTPNAGAVAASITIGTADQTLEQIRDKINAAGAGVNATVVTDLNGSRLSLQSAQTGAANGFRVRAVDSDGSNIDANGLSALAFDPPGGTASTVHLQAGANASATINGLTVASASNTLVDSIAGLSIDLNKIASTAVSVTVAADTEAIKKSTQSFVDAYNGLAKLLGEQTRYDAASKVAGPLQGDSAATSLQTRLRSLLGQSSGASPMFARLSDAGFELQRDGTLSLNATRLDNALAKLPELQKLFATNDLLDDANDGFGVRLRGLADQVLGIDGPLTSRSDGLRRQLESNADRQDALELRVAQTEKRLRAQYTALDATLGRLSGLSDYVTQQMNVMTRANDQR